MAVVTGSGVVLKGADIAQDQSFNSVVISPVSGNSTPSALKQTDANGNSLLQTDTAGKLTAAALSTTGAISGATVATTGKVTVGGDLQSTGGNTTLGPTTVSNITSNGTARVNSSLTVTGGIDVGSVNSNGDILAQGKLTVNKGVQTIGLLTATGGLSSPSNGISVQGGTTTDSLVASGNTSLQGTVSTGALTSSSVKSNGALSATGATTLAGLSATSSNISGNETVGGTLGVTGATTLNALTASSSNITGSETVAATLTAKNLVLTSGGGGALTFADGTTMTTAASGTGGGGGGGSGTALDTIYMGLHSAANGNYPTAYTANNGYFVNTQLQGTTPLNTGSAYVTPYAGTIYSIEIFAVSASNPITVNLYKNGQPTSLVATSTTAGGAFYALASTNNPISVVAGDLLQLFIKGTTANMTNSCIGWCTVQPAASASAGTNSAIASRAILDMGGIFNTGLNGGSLYGIYKAVPNATSPGTYSSAAFYDRLVRQPFAYTVTGYSVINQLNQAFTMYYYKNGANIGSFSIPATAGSYAASHARGTYAFAVNDTFRVVVQPAGSQISMQVDAIIEWT